MPSRDVADVFVETIGILCVTFMEEEQIVLQWVSQAVQNVPVNVLTLENKSNMVETVSNASNFRLSRLNYELNLLAKRARSSAIRE